MPEPKAKRRPVNTQDPARTPKVKKEQAGKKRKRTETAAVNPKTNLSVEHTESEMRLSPAYVSPALNIATDQNPYCKQELSPDFGKDVQNLVLRPAQPAYPSTDYNYTSHYPFGYPNQNSTFPFSHSYVCSNENLQPGAFQPLNSSQACDTSPGPTNANSPFHNSTWGAQGITQALQPEQTWPANPAIQGPSFTLPIRSSNNGFGVSNESAQFAAAAQPEAAQGSIPNPFNTEYFAPTLSSFSPRGRHPNHSLAGAFGFPRPPDFHM